MPRVPAQDPLDLFVPEPNTGCWLWLGKLNVDGYGFIRQRLAHRLVWSLLRGAIPEGMYLLHACDTRSCVSPYHLRVGTARENATDTKQRGRVYRGGGRSRAELARIAADRKRARDHGQG